MKTVLVSIITGQNIPNLLLIKELQGQYDELLFITTERMESENRSRHLELAAGLPPGSVERWEVDNASLSQTKKNLEVKPAEGKKYIVNITGGTKIITLGVFNHFARPGNEIVYLPIGKNLIEPVFPDGSRPPQSIITRLTLEQYLQAYGIGMKSKTATKKSFGELKLILKNFQNKGYNIKSLQEGYPPEWLNYFTGEWFEEWLYHRLKQQLNLGDDYIKTNVELLYDHPQEVLSKNDQEIDVAFIRENTLYILEAKASIRGNKAQGQGIYNFLFKLSAINKTLGLSSRPYLVTLADLGARSSDYQNELKRKMSLLKISGVIDRNGVISNSIVQYF